MKEYDVSHGLAHEFVSGLERKGVTSSLFQELVEHPKTSLQLMADMIQNNQFGTDADGYERLGEYQHRLQGCFVLDSGEHKLISAGHWIIRGNAHVKEVIGPAVIEEISGEAVVEKITDAVVKKIKGQATVYCFIGHTMVGSISENAHVVDLFSMTTVYGIFGDAVIDQVGGATTVAMVDGNVKIGNVNSHAVLGNVHGNVTIDSLEFGALVRYHNSHGELVTIDKVKGGGMVIQSLPMDEGFRVITERPVEVVAR